MRHSNTRWAALALVVVALTGCGSDDNSAPPPQPPAGATTAQIISAAAADPANDSATNSSAPFTVMQSTSVPAVLVKSPPVVNFTVFSDGKVVQGLTNANARFAIAKLTPSANGEPDQWSNYVYSKETTAPPYGPGGTPVLPSATRAATDPNTPAQLTYNADGYYTYSFATDITDPTKTNGVIYEPGKTHRIAIQLSYNNAAGETVLVNPYFDFTLGADGKSVTVTDKNATRVMADVNSCNGCHEKLALHGGGRVDVQYCVMCHNPGTTDGNSGNVLTMSTMTHKIHAGRLLKTKLDQGLGGEEYRIWGYQNSEHNYAEVGFPQDLRNCAKCHSSDPKLTQSPTPQGDNWKTKVSKEACLTCHASNPPERPANPPLDWRDQADASWYSRHSTFFGGADPRTMTNAQCMACHNPASNPTLSPERVHFNQNEDNAAKYKMNIESVAFKDTANHKGRTVTVKYFLSDPTNGDAAYNLVTPDCAAGPACSGDAKFGNLSLYLAYQNMVGQLAGVTEFSAYNNGGGNANAKAYKGANDGNNHYTVDIPLPDDTATAIASGTARVVSSGQIKEVQLQAKSAADPRPPVVPTTLINVVAQHTYKDVVLSGTLQPRRQVVANEKCGVCHGALGTTTGSNNLTLAIHGGARSTVETCTMCHDANRIYSNLTVMTNGLEMSESYQFKRMIHGIHGNSKRTHPFTHGNLVVGEFGKDNLLGPAGGFKVGAVATAPDSALFSPYAGDTFVTPGTPLAGIGVINYAAEVNWPGVGLNCNACHVNNSYFEDLGTLGAAIAKPIIGRLPPKSEDQDPNTWRVISPKAASCTGCHTSATAIGHVTSFGGSSFGDKTQGEIALLPRETCNDCHAPGGFMGVDIVHGLK